MTKLSTVQSHIESVTPEQIGKAHKVFDSQNKPFYLVESSDGKLREDGSLVEYRVSSMKVNGVRYLTCTCPAGEHGLLCWHKKAASAASQEERQALSDLAKKQAEDAYLSELVERSIREEEQHQAEQAKKPVKTRKARWDKRYEQNKGFSLMR